MSDRVLGCRPRVYRQQRGGSGSSGVVPRACSSGGVARTVRGQHDVLSASGSQLQAGDIVVVLPSRQRRRVTAFSRRSVTAVAHHRRTPISWPPYTRVQCASGISVSAAAPAVSYCELLQRVVALRRVKTTRSPRALCCERRLPCASLRWQSVDWCTAFRGCRPRALLPSDTRRQRLRRPSRMRGRDFSCAGLENASPSPLYTGLGPPRLHR